MVRQEHISPEDRQILSREPRVPYTAIVNNLFTDLPAIIRNGSAPLIEDSIAMLNIALLETGMTQKDEDRIRKLIDGSKLSERRDSAERELNLLLAMNNFEKYATPACNTYLLPDSPDELFYRTFTIVQANTGSFTADYIIGNTIESYARQAGTAKSIKERKQISARLRKLTSELSQSDPSSYVQYLRNAAVRLVRTPDDGFTGNYTDILLKLSRFDHISVDDLIKSELYRRTCPMSQEQLLEFILRADLWHRPAILKEIIPHITDANRKQLLSHILPEHARNLKKLLDDKRVPLKLFFAVAAQYKGFSVVDYRQIYAGLRFHKLSKVRNVAGEFAMKNPMPARAVMFEAPKKQARAKKPVFFKLPIEDHDIAGWIASLPPESLAVVLRYFTNTLGPVEHPLYRRIAARYQRAAAYSLSLLRPASIDSLLQEYPSSESVRKGILNALIWLYRHRQAEPMVVPAPSDPAPGHNHKRSLLTAVFERQHPK